MASGWTGDHHERAGAREVGKPGQWRDGEEDRAGDKHHHQRGARRDDDRGGRYSSGYPTTAGKGRKGGGGRDATPPSSPQTGGLGRGDSGRKPLPTVGGGGLDQFTLGDIRKAEKTLEKSHMSLGQYARKVAQGEITKTADEEDANKLLDDDDGFFASEIPDGEDDGGRMAKWLKPTEGSSGPPMPQPHLPAGAKTLEELEASQRQKRQQRAAAESSRMQGRNQQSVGQVSSTSSSTRYNFVARGQMSNEFSIYALSP
ncbi:hypothetical protein FOZ63_000039 [Perkinsus olseni]|uniref:Uncharacterized protein n=1 Tax=Perkinsus olseni TaxID=32597 RepID=A0A7J6UIL0_PEROL|nr:hypothetical protein FOZ63_000039 [Perkinsus olseni]